MKIVNASKVPDIIFKWLQQDFYDSDEAEGTLSITTLLKPVQETVLIQRHNEDITVDAMERLFSLLGSGVHAVLEKVESKDIVPIERLFWEIEGRKISGKYDLIRKKSNKVTDFKVTSAWSVVYGSRIDDWRHQLSSYRYLYFKNKKVLLSDVGSIIGIFRDWRESDAQKEGYPKQPIMEMNVKLLGIDETESFLKDKVKNIIRTEPLADNRLPQCSDEDRWFNPRSRKNAKCEKYCLASEFCSQWKRIKAVA